MNRDEVRKLIGGYATGTLTEAERAMLFAAALEDQELFDELAGEQVFKELLDAPGARARLLTAVAPTRQPRRQSWWAWGAIAAAAAAGLVLFIATRPATHPAVEVATVKQEPALDAADSVARRAEPSAPAPQAAVPQLRLKAQEEAPAQQAGRQGQQGAASPGAFDRFGRVAAPAPPPAPAKTAPPPLEDRQRATDQIAAVAAPAETTLLKTESAEVAPATAASVKQLPVPGVAAGKGGGGGKRIALAETQGRGGTITGAVSDPAGGVIAGAPIEVRNADTGALYTAASLATGTFTLPQLPAGNYALTVAVAGFKRFVRPNITLQGTQVLRLDVPLELGTSTESVTVTSVAPATGQLSTTANALLLGRAKAAVPFAFTYQRAADSLRITPSAPGLLLVTAAGQTLFPQNNVLAGSNVIVPLPAGTGDVTIVFAASAAAPATQAVRREGATGTVTEPNPSPNTRLAIIVPALR